MDQINIRYGESVVLPIDTGDVSDASADIFIGRPGELYIITKHLSLVNGTGTFTFSPVETQIPLGTYYYQINVTDGAGHLDKYPSPDDECDGCSSVFPEFIVNEALDQIEVS